MTSFALKESILFGAENGSKVFACFLDAKQAFDRVWHNGLFSKLFDAGVDIQVFKAFISMYSGLKSQVKFRGRNSEWFPVLQGTRQGGVSSPKLYLLYIDGLIKELELSGLGFCIYGTCFACPTVADDMCLVSFSKSGMDKMLDICYKYSCKWRFEYNAKKCAIVVFNERPHLSKKTNRTWRLGPESVEEEDCYTHLGISLNKYLNIGQNIADARKRLTTSFFTLVGCGLAENGIHPLTMLNIYNSVVIPKTLYDCELWSDISRAEILSLEQAQRKCIRFMQGISNKTRSDIALSLLGCKVIESVIDYRKLIFFGQLCSLDVKYLAKTIFIDRLVRYNDMPYKKKGFLPDIYRLLCKYHITHYFHDYVRTGIFPVKCKWKYVIKRSVCEFELSERHSTMGNDPIFSPYLVNIVNVLTPVPIWLLCKEYPSLLNDCKSAVNILSCLYSHEFVKKCSHCDTLYVNYAVHLVFDCSRNEHLRQRLWTDIYRTFGHSVFVSLIRLEPKSQIVHLCFGLCQFLSCDSDRERCLRLVVTAFSRMIC